MSPVLRKTLAVMCFLSFGSIALAAPTLPAPTALPQVEPALIKVLLASEEASTKLETRAVANSVVVHSLPPALKGAPPPPRTLTAELVFDTAKDGVDVRKNVELLKGLAVVDATKKRPSIVRVVWGADATFEGVIADIGVKYTMFSSDGTPVRASCSPTFREGQRCLNDSACPSGQTCVSSRCTTSR